MVIQRTIENSLLKYLIPGKVNVLFGARRVGKTFLIRHIVDKLAVDYIWLNGELPEVHDILGQKNVANYKNFFANKELLIIDEAQEIPDIGKILKIIVDEIPTLKIIASGSSSFDLSNQLGEPLVGRAHWHELFPFAQMELNNYETLVQTKQHLEERLVYGSYPELYFIEGFEEKEKYLKELANAYLLKDIISFEGIRNSSKIYDLLKLIAFQLAKEVSLQELGRQLGISKNTVEKYLDLLEKVYVLKNIKGFSKNLRKEITKTSKWYFWDNGIRNTLINDYRPINLRTDAGELWENYLMTERIKKNNGTSKHKETYFWRTYDQQEIDCIELKNNVIEAFEFKWGNKTAKAPKAFIEAYPDAKFEVINKSNYLDFIA